MRLDSTKAEHSTATIMYRKEQIKQRENQQHGEENSKVHHEGDEQVSIK